QQIFRYGRDKRALLKTLSLPELFGKLCYFSLPLGVPCGLLLLILALVLKPLRPVVFSGAAVYLMAVWAEAIFLKSRYCHLLFWGIVGTHLSYCYGFWCGHGKK
ncbi:MAG TPA: hypothetical protein PKX93_01120, partial [bacterium]|nr:hypothetical protein [bacterium]